MLVLVLMCFFDHSTPGTNLGMARRTASTTAPSQSFWCACMCIAALKSVYTLLLYGLQTVSTAHMESQGQQTDNATTSGSIASKTSVIGHRDAFAASPDLNGTTCSLRLRYDAL